MNRFIVALAALIALGPASPAVAQVPAAHVSPLADGIRLESQGSLYWLHTDEDADTLWPRLKDFLASEGLVVGKEEPQLGYMETRWSRDLLLDKVLSILLSDQAPTRRERFRLRLERMQDDGTRIFIYHSAYGILFDEEAVYTGYLPASHELEIEMLSRLAQFLGGSEQQVREQAASYVTTRLEARRLSADEYEISAVPGTEAFVREKLQRALGRMAADVSLRPDGLMVASYSKIPELVSEDSEWEIDDNSDLEEKGFGDADTGKAARLVYLIELKPAANTVSLRIRAHRENTDNGRGLSKFSSVLAERLASR